MSIYDLDFKDASYDCVTMQEVLEHLEGAAQAVKEINRILKVGGVADRQRAQPILYSGRCSDFSASSWAMPGVASAETERGSAPRFFFRRSSGTVIFSHGRRKPC